MDFSVDEMKKGRKFTKTKVSLEYSRPTVLRYGIVIATLRLKSERLGDAKRRMWESSANIMRRCTLDN
jgi:hypothetical protein